MTKGEKIKNLRESAGINQVELAEIVGVSKQTMYKYENDLITNIPSDVIEAIAEATHATPSFIVGWKEPGSSVKTQSAEESSLLYWFRKLNEKGKERAIIAIEELTEIDRYTEGD